MNLPRPISKKAQAQRALAQPGAPRAFSPQRLQAYLAQQGCALPPRTLSLALDEWEQAKVIIKHHAQAYLNAMAQPKPTPEELVPLLRPQALVSGPRVLGEAGIINNPSLVITAIMPIGKSRKSGTVQTSQTTFIFAALPDHLATPQDPHVLADAIDPEHPHKVTPEKAIIDWLHVCSSPHGRHKHALPPPHDWDWDMVDVARLKRLVDGLGWNQQWDALRTTIGGPDLSATTAPALARKLGR